MVTTKHEFYTRHNPDRPLCTDHPDNLALRGSNGSPGIHDTELPGQSHVASDSDDEEALQPNAEADAARDDDTIAERAKLNALAKKDNSVSDEAPQEPVPLSVSEDSASESEDEEPRPKYRLGIFGALLPELLCDVF